MRGFILSALIVGAFASNLPLKDETRAPLDEDFGYVEVRPGAHMFWVTYHTDGKNVDGTDFDYNTTPLIMWLQGGPGASGVSYGNFEELGPRDIYGNLRTYRWTQKANLMFVDNPVGSGYSYVEDLSLLTTTNQEIADDLVSLLKSVFATQPEYQTMPFYVYCESYGGKMTADFALAWDAAIKNGEVVSDFRGVGLGDSWISPMDSLNTWGSFLYSMGFVNEEEQLRIDNSAATAQAAVDAGDWVAATNAWSNAELVVLAVTGGVSFYNVLETDEGTGYKKRNPGYLSSELKNKVLGISTFDALEDFMNTPEQKARWNIPANVTHGAQSNDVFGYLEGDFMKPVIASVVNLIDNTNLIVAVYTGDLDLICDTPGTYLWVDEMQYNIKAQWEDTARDAIKNTVTYANTAGYVQRYDNFALITFLRAGHMVPLDAGEMSFTMIDMIYGYANEAASEAANPTLLEKVEKAKASLPQEKVEKVRMIQIEERMNKDPHPEHHVHPAYSQRIQHNKVNKMVAQVEDTILQEKIEKDEEEEKIKNEIRDAFNRYRQAKKEKYEEVPDAKKDALKANIANLYKNRATPEGRRMNKERHFDPRKPLFNQNLRKYNQI